MTRFRSDRIWRLGEKEFRKARYVQPATLELHDALEDRERTPLSEWRYRNGVMAQQLTSPNWHRYWVGAHL